VPGPYLYKVPLGRTFASHSITSSLATLNIFNLKCSTLHAAMLYYMWCAKLLHRTQNFLQTAKMYTLQQRKNVCIVSPLCCNFSTGCDGNVHRANYWEYSCVCQVSFLSTLLFMVVIEWMLFVSHTSVCAKWTYPGKIWNFADYSCLSGPMVCCYPFRKYIINKFD